MTLGFPVISEDQKRSYLNDERKTAKATRDQVVEYIKTVFCQENPDKSVEVCIWSDDYYCWIVSVFPDVPGGSNSIASYWVQKFPVPTETAEACKKYQQKIMPNAVFVDFAELSGIER